MISDKRCNGFHQSTNTSLICQDLEAWRRRVLCKILSGNKVHFLVFLQRLWCDNILALIGMDTSSATRGERLKMYCNHLMNSSTLSRERWSLKFPDLAVLLLPLVLYCCKSITIKTSLNHQSEVVSSVCGYSLSIIHVTYKSPQALLWAKHYCHVSEMHYL